VLVTTLQKRENYGTNAEVVEFGCLECAGGETLLIVAYDIYASR
jgi:hypothetical protein